MGACQWLKAVHYDPAKNNGKGGWWRYPNTSDTAPVPGIPGVGETSAGYDPYSYSDGFEVPLGSYPNTLTPWGLLDATGGASEWTESWHETVPAHLDRFYDGAPAGNASLAHLDAISRVTSSVPTVGDAWLGLRLATVPSPQPIFPILVGIAHFIRRRKHA